MSSSSLPMPEEEHGRRRRSTPATVTMTASDDPTAGRSAAAATMAIGDEREEEEEEVMGAEVEGPIDDADLVLVGMPSGRLVLAPTPLSSMKPDADEVSPPLPPAAANGEKEKQCVLCGATETPQWRMPPTGKGVLCNACRIWLRPAEALREPVLVHHFLPQPATATVIAAAESPVAAEYGWISEAWMMDFDAYLLKKKSPSPTTEPAPPPPPPEEEKTQTKRRRKPCIPRRKPPAKQCDHCKATSTPKWRTGPRGPRTLCNACGLGYCQGRRVLQQYRPAASPSLLKPSGKHREEVLEKKHNMGKEQHQPPQPAARQEHAAGGDELPMGSVPNPLVDQSLLNATIDDGSLETLTVYGVDGDNLMMGDPSSLDQFLFDGPAAPPLIDDDDD